MGASFTDTLRQGFADRGWDPDDLGRFRMEDPAPEGAPPAGDPGGQSAENAGQTTTATPPATRDPATGRFTAADVPDDFDSLEGTYEEMLRGDGDVIPLPRDVLAKLQGEHKKYRERWQGVERRIGNLNDNDREAFLGLIEEYQRDPVAAARWMADNARNLAGEKWADIAKDLMAAKADTASGTTPAEELDPFDPASVQSYVERQVKAGIESFRSEQSKEREVEQANQKIIDAGKALGYTTDPTDPEWSLLLLTARRMPGLITDNLPKAHEALEAKWSEKSKTYLQAKGADATRTTAPQQGAAPSGRKVPRSMEEAEESARTRLDSILRDALSANT